MRADSTQAPAPNEKQLRSFGLIFGGFVAGLFGVILPLIWGRDFPVWPWAIGGVMGVWSFAAPASLRSFHDVWLKFGELISRVTTPLILGICFFLIVFPVGIVRRTLSSDPLARDIDPAAESFRRKSAQRSKNDLEKPF